MTKSPVVSTCFALLHRLLTSAYSADLSPRLAVTKSAKYIHSARTTEATVVKILSASQHYFQAMFNTFDWSCVLLRLDLQYSTLVV
jgi:hypothetical protein